MNNPEVYDTVVKVVCIPFIIALISISFPLILQSISRIEDKYSSKILLDRFYNNLFFKTYIVFLLLPLISIPLWFLDLPRVWDCKIFNGLVEMSSFLIIVINTFLLVLNLFVLARLIYVFFNSSRLLKHLIKKYKKTTSKKRKKYFDSILDLIDFSIKNPCENIDEEIVDFLRSYLESVRKKGKERKNQEINYSYAYYKAIKKANAQLCSRKEVTLSAYNGNTLVNLFIDNTKKTIISENTYGAIWSYLKDDLQYKRDDLIMSYWQHAHQHFNSNMKIIKKEWNVNYDVIVNQKVIDERDAERERFLEFHYALGGLIMYLGEIELLQRIMAYSHTNLSVSVLVPNLMEEVLKGFISIEKTNSHHSSLIKKYKFPDSFGIESSDIIIKSIRKYYALLFLRQFTLPSCWYGRTSLDLPSIPESLLELNVWKKKLEILKGVVKELLAESQLLKRAGFGYLNDEWFLENKKQRPEELINTFIQKINDKYDTTKKEQTVSM